MPAPQNPGRKHRVLVSNIPPDTSMSQMRDLLQHLFPRINQFVAGMRPQAPGKPMQATLLCKSREQAVSTKKELHMFTFNGYKLRASVIDSNSPHDDEDASRQSRELQEQLIQIERAKLALEEQQRKVMNKLKNPPLENKPSQKPRPVSEKERGKKHGQSTIIEDILSAYEFMDKHGKVTRITGARKKNMETAVRAICYDLEKIIPDNFVLAELKADFDTVVREKVRANMIALMANEPVLCPTKYVLKYRIDHPLERNIPFLQSMRDKLYNMPQFANAPRPKSNKSRTAVKSKRADEIVNALGGLKDEPRYLEWIQQTANNNCWYMDYTLDKLLHKAFENVKNGDTIENDQTVKGETENTTETGDAAPAESQPKEYKDLSNIEVDQFLAKIKANEDMDSVKRYIDIRLAKLLNKIKTEMIMTATQGSAHAGLHIRLKQIGLDGQKLKSWRKLHYATVATPTSMTSSFLSQFSVIAAWQSKPFRMLKYSQNNVALLSKTQYDRLLLKHLQSFNGERVGVIKSFPDDEEEVKLQEGEVINQNDSSIKEEADGGASMETTAEETEYGVDEDMPGEPENVAVEA